MEKQQELNLPEENDENGESEQVELADPEAQKHAKVSSEEAPVKTISNEEEDGEEEMNENIEPG